MSQPNPAEQAATETWRELQKHIDDGMCFRLEAGAGAGKTYSLIEAIRYLIGRKAEELIKNEQQIACITYTNVAKREIEERTDHHPVIFADTIHTFCWQLIKDYQAKLRELLPTLSKKWTERIEAAGGITQQNVYYELGFPSIDAHSITLHHDDVVDLTAQILTAPKFQKAIKSKFPIIFIDEYQDTNLGLAESIVENLIDNDSGVLVGFFGDHWQKIYGSSACGLVNSQAGKIIEIGKKANFRSDKNIVDCLNRMRQELPQAVSDPASQGEVKVFHSNSWTGERLTGAQWKDDLPLEETKDHLRQVQTNLEQDGWDFNSSDTKVLFLTNNMIAEEQGFRNLASCFKYTDDYLKKANKYIEFFLEVVEPVASAFELKEYGELFSVGGGKYPLLSCQADKRAWAGNLGKLVGARTQGNVGDVIDLLVQTKLPRLPEKLEREASRLIAILQRPQEDLSGEDSEFSRKLGTLRAVPYEEVINLGHYIDERTPFSTKHGVKGAQFDNVLVVCGRGWNHYNWNQLLEWMENEPPENKLAAFERNRNLFYVCCSRAKHNLTLLFTQELSATALATLYRVFGDQSVIGSPYTA